MLQVENLMIRTLCVAIVLLGALTAARANAATIASDAGSTSQPELVLDRAALEFGSLSETRTFNIANRGTAPLDIQRIVAVPEGTGVQVGDTGAHTLAPGESLDVRVVYTPEPRRQQMFGGIQIWSNDPRFAVDERNPSAHVAALAVRANSSRLLTLIIFFPLLAAGLVLLVPRGRDELARWIALGGTLVPLAGALWMLVHFDRNYSMSSGNAGLQFVQHAVWIPSFNVEYFVGVDGLSVTMVILTTLVSVIALIASWGIRKQVRGYLALFLLLETGMVGTFCALDFFLFYIFWELMLLPMYFLIGIWGGPRKEYAAIKFFLYTLFGSVLILLAIIALYYNAAPTTLVDGTPASHSFDMVKLAYANDWQSKRLLLVGLDFTKVVWIALFIGFAIKIPMFPFHTWLPDAHVEAPTAISVILAGVLLKMGTYGILRVNFAILPHATQWAAPTMAIFGAINILYGAFCAFAQRDLKKLVAYSSVSHMGYCLVGMAAFTQSGFSGALLQMFNHGTITAMLFLLVGVLYDRAHTRDIDQFGGMATQMPRYAALFGFAFMASLGLPGLSGFIGEVLVFLGAFPVYRAVTIVAMTGVIVTAAYHLWALQRIQLGKWNDAVWKDRSIFPDLSAREAVTLLPLAAIVLVLGFWPTPMLALINNGLADLLRHVTDNAGAGALAGLR
jgi:NADH-quinone oxidoreductase subunit M